MAKKNELERLGKRVGQVGEYIGRIDWRGLPGVEKLSDEELEALRCGALAMGAMVEAETGRFGRTTAKKAAAKSPGEVAAAVLATAVKAHVHFTVDGDTTGDDREPEAKVRITIEHKG